MGHRVSRLFVPAVALMAVLTLVGCTRPENGEVFAYECGRRAIQQATTTDSLAAAVAHEAAGNRKYRDCVERSGVRVGSLKAPRS